MGQLSFPILLRRSDANASVSSPTLPFLRQRFRFFANGLKGSGCRSILFSLLSSSFAVFVSSGPLVASTEADGEDLPGFTTSVKVLHYVLREITVCYTGPIS